MASSRKKSSTTPLTGQDIDQALTHMARLVVGEDPNERVTLLGLVHDLIRQGRARSMAEWAADPTVGADRASLLSILMATKDDEDGIERLALLAARSIRLSGTPDAASIAIASYLCSPDGFDLFRSKHGHTLEAVPEEIRIMFGGRMGESLEALGELGISVRAERLAGLFGYAYSGTMDQDLVNGIVQDDGAQLLARSDNVQWDIRIKPTGHRKTDGATGYEIMAREGAGVGAGVRGSYRPDVAFVNESHKRIVISLTFSGANAKRQRDEINKYLTPLLDAVADKNSPWYGYCVAPFYVHAGTFVPNDPTPRAGYRTTEALIAQQVPENQQCALATLELMAVAMHAESPEQVVSFFKCNPLVGGTTTLEHLRHVERTAALPTDHALERHVAFLAQHATQALSAAAMIAYAPDTEGIVDQALENVYALLNKSEKAFGGMSQQTFDEQWAPMVDTVRSLSQEVIRQHGSNSDQPLGKRINRWTDLLTASKRSTNLSFAHMQEEYHANLLASGKDTGFADQVTVIHLPKKLAPRRPKR
jgi:hypothetical protein